MGKQTVCQIEDNCTLFGSAVTATVHRQNTFIKYGFHLSITSQKTKYYSVSRAKRPLLSKEIITFCREAYEAYTHTVDKVPIF